MGNHFITIRHLTADSRMISLQTGLPQYLVQQVKTKLFLAAKEQNKAVCEWWLRLYHDEGSGEDVRALTEATEGDYYTIEHMEEIWTTDLDGGEDLEY